MFVDEGTTYGVSPDFNSESISPFMGQFVTLTISGNMVTRITSQGTDIPFVEGTSNLSQQGGACGTADDMINPHDSTPQNCNARKRLWESSSSTTPASGSSQSPPTKVGKFAACTDEESPEITRPTTRRQNQLLARSSTGARNGVVDDSDHEGEEEDTD